MDGHRNVNEALEAQAIFKRYGKNAVLNGVSLTVARGTVHALVGHNGAGKSTLLRILAGAEEPDHGQILVNGQPVRLFSPRHAQQLGIAAVYQELHVIDCLSIAQNIF